MPTRGPSSPTWSAKTRHPWRDPPTKFPAEPDLVGQTRHPWRDPPTRGVAFPERHRPREDGMSVTTDHRITTVDELREVVGQPIEGVDLKVGDVIDDYSRGFLAK